ncbi:MAG: Xanthine phosphoribosyltransferase [Candidatus Woesearchaeota archaeon]|nr:Xanthine phosphoribosyltransferase [Candidatus Woesearchaeota archaeon]
MVPVNCYGKRRIIGQDISKEELIKAGVKQSLIPDLKSVILMPNEIDTIISELADKISQDYKESEELLLAGVLKGAYRILPNLAEKITIPCVIDFMSVSSYGGGQHSSGEVRILKDLQENIQGRNVIIVEDIADTRYTLGTLLSLLNTRNPDSLEVCCLLDKPERMQNTDVDIRYIGATVPDVFVVGYGLDFDSKYRDMPIVAELKKECYL